MGYVIIAAGHPFFAKVGRPTIHRLKSQWMVKWRDFSTMKQDATFRTEREARDFAATINVPPLKLYEEDGPSIAESDQFWRTT